MKEALKLALDFVTMHHTDEGYSEMRASLRQLAKEALAQPKQEPVACVEYIPCCTDQTCQKCKAAAPPQRPWVGLTDEEYDEIWRMDLNNKDIMGKTIAKLKQKNT